MNSSRKPVFLVLSATLVLLAGIVKLRAAAGPQATPPPAQSDATAAKPKQETKPTADTPAPPKPASTPTPAPAAPAKAAQAKQLPPANSSGMVWVNTESGVYHKPGSRYYGKTKQGRYMTEADAIKAGYRAAEKK